MTGWCANHIVRTAVNRALHTASKAWNRAAFPRRAHTNILHLWRRTWPVSQHFGSAAGEELIVVQQEQSPRAPEIDTIFPLRFRGPFRNNDPSRTDIAARPAARTQRTRPKYLQVGPRLEHFCLGVTWKESRVGKKKKKKIARAYLFLLHR